MAMDQKEEPTTKLSLAKIPGVGGNGGRPFDSGCNPTGVWQVHVECGPIFSYVLQNGKYYTSTVKRIFLRFHKTCSNRGDAIYYHWYPAGLNVGTKKYFFNVNDGDSIVKTVVWSDGFLVNAIQFYTEKGIVSPMYGLPRPESLESEFKGPQGSQLVGIHGRYGAAIDKLGFSFAKVNERPHAAIMASPCLPEGMKWNINKIAAVGGCGGRPFDSGCNPSNVKKVHIEIGSMMTNFQKDAKYPCTIKRIYLEFDDYPGACDNTDVAFHGCSVRGQWEKEEHTFEVNPDDGITKIVVWSDGTRVTAVQLHTLRGFVSPMYGMYLPGLEATEFEGGMPLPGSEATEFEGGPSSRLAGIHGRFGTAVDQLGFSFATATKIASDAPSGDESTCSTDESDHVSELSS
ncbi:Jacalin-related lectin [Seminavis robusta]|uniref:Jacalin-related lectin n=1 Tax=Seminavis robusta TaxID=568900 RepID=A0A9N8DBJ4_9STRA|nr:Jacalin-related lectin [Seminavis robusta]|eukprot:Sro45_g027010.1 Jacalin-related lectin (402) ;mRNA; r:92973-94178